MGNLRDFLWKTRLGFPMENPIGCFHLHNYETTMNAKKVEMNCRQARTFNSSSNSETFLSSVSSFLQHNIINLILEYSCTESTTDSPTSFCWLCPILDLKLFGFLCRSGFNWVLHRKTVCQRVDSSSFSTIYSTRFILDVFWDWMFCRIQCFFLDLMFVGIDA